MILEKGQKPLDIVAELEKLKVDALEYQIRRQGEYIKIEIKDTKAIKRLKELGFSEIQS